MTIRSSLQTLVEHIQDGGISDWAVARKVLGATLGTLGARLTNDEASALGRTLPPELACIVEGEEYDSDFDAAEFYERVRRRTDAPPGLAREHTDIVLRAMGQVLDKEIVARLGRVLPEPIARCLVAPAFGEPPPYAALGPEPSRNTLATGRPGSSHPISESAPPGGQRHSVAENDDPHGETKLSSTHGLTQERFNETLATGRPPKPAR